MTMQTRDYKTLPGGSIDYGHYLARAHTIRSDDAHGIVRTVWQALRKLRLKGSTYRQGRPSVYRVQGQAS